MNRHELFEDLKFELGGMKLNKLEGTKEKKLILGSGNLNGDILFIGDDPDLYDDEDLRVAVGSNGEFFLRLCDLAEMSPSSYYMTNISKCALKWRELSELEKMHMKDLLEMQIAILKPKIIVTLGSEATSALLNKEVKIVDVRGKLTTFIGGIKLIPIFDPAYVKRMRDSEGRGAKAAKEFWSDLKKIKSELEEVTL